MRFYCRLGIVGGLMAGGLAASLLLARPVLARGSQPAAAAGLITVTTTLDEFDAAPNGQCSLREAIQTLNTGAAFGGCPAGLAGDTILLADGATYALTRAGADEDANATGDLDVLVSLRLQPVSGRAALSAAGLGDRVLETQAGVITLQDLTLTGGDVTGLVTPYGGGLRNTATVTLTRVDLTHNRALMGGGVFNESGAPGLTVELGLIAQNTAQMDGGGIYNRAALLLTNSSVISNSASNLAGGLYNEAVAAVVLRNTTVSSNTVTVGDGGGLYNVGTGQGMTLNNVTVTGNYANNNAGGLHNGGPLKIANSVLAGNLSSQDADCWGTGMFESKGYNVLGAGAAAACALTGNVATVVSTTAPLLGPLAENGGRTLTHALLAGSPALDQGNPAAPAGGWTCETADQRGITRIGRCDAGAYDTGLLVQLFLPLVTRQP